MNTFWGHRSEQHRSDQTYTSQTTGRLPRTNLTRGISAIFITALVAGGGVSSVAVAHATQPTTQQFIAEDDVTISEAIEPTVAADGRTNFPVTGEFSLVPGSTSTITVPVPEGMSPELVTATLLGPEGKTIELSSSARPLGTIESASGPVNIAVSAEDLTAENTLALSFDYEGFTGTWCAVDGTAGGNNIPLNISDVSLTVSGDAAMPSSVSEFFTGAQNAIVEIPAESDEALTFAALDMVAGASSIMGQESDVRLIVSGSSEAATVMADLNEIPAALQRKVTLQPGEGDAVTSITADDTGSPRLTLTGGSPELTAAAAAFGLDALALASDADTRGLAATSTPGDVTAAQQTLTLADLGVETISLQGYGSNDAFVNVSQASFGGMLEQIDVNLVGTVSSTAETVTTVQLLWNSVLVDSFNVDPDVSEINRTVTVPATALRSGNGLVIRMQAVNTAQVCVDERLLPPVRMDISTGESTVIATRGSSAVASFQDFPQAFAGTADIAFGAEATSAQITAAGQLVAALQRSQPNRLAFNGVTADELVTGSASGVLIGATADQAQELRTPLRFADLRRISDSGDELTVAVEQPYAALQAVRESDRSLLVLGEHLDGSAADTSVMLAATSDLSGSSWQGLDGSVRLATPGAEPVVLDVNEIIPQAEAKADFNPIAFWAIGLLALLIIAGVLASGVRKRRKRTAELAVASEIDATEKLRVNKHEAPAENNLDT